MTHPKPTLRLCGAASRMVASPLTKAVALAESEAGYCILGVFEVSGKIGGFRFVMGLNFKMSFLDRLIKLNGSLFSFE